MIGLSANPDQNVTIAIQVLDGYGQRTDGYTSDGYTPQVDFVITPNGSQFSGYPENMARISEGLYNSTIVIPSGIASVGTYLASVSWIHPDNGTTQYELFLIHVARPFGVATVTPA